MKKTLKAKSEQNNSRSSEEQFLALIELLPDAFLQGDSKGNIISLNSKAIELTGYSRKELLSMNISALFTSDMPEGKPLRYKRLRRGEIIKGEKEISKKTGEKIQVYFNLEAMPDGTYRIIITDITEQKQAEELIFRNEEHYKKACELTSDYIFKLGINSVGKVTMDFVSENFFKITGRRREDVKELDDWTAIFNSDDLGRVMQLLQTMCKSRQTGEIECQTYSKNGQSRWVHVVAKSQWSESEQRIVSIIGSVKDITEQKKTELRIVKINRLYSVISQINQMIVRTQEKDKILSDVCRIAIEYGKFRMAWIGMVDEKNKLIKPVVWEGAEEGYLSSIKVITFADVPEGRGPTGKAIREGRHSCCNDIANDSAMLLWRDEALKRGYRSSIAIPIIIRRKTIGAFNLYASEPFFFDELEIDLLVEVTSNIAYTLEILENEEQRKRTEEALRFSEEKFSKAFLASPDSITISILNTGLFIEVNPGFENIFGFSRSEAIGHSSLELKLYAVPEDREKLVVTLNEKGHVHNLELKGRRKSGELFTGLLSAEIIKISGESCMVTVIRDITESKKFLEALSRSESNFRNLFEHSPLGKSLTELDGTINVNKSFCDILGYSQEELQKIKWMDLTHPEDIQASNDYVRQLKDGKIQKARFEKRYIHKNGNIIWAEVSTYMQHDQNGSPQFLITTISDITERKHLEQKIIESEAYYRTLVDLSPDGILIIDLEGKISYGSRKMYEIFSVPPDANVLGTSVIDWISPDYHEMVMQRIKDILSGNTRPEIREYRLLKYDKQPFWAELSGSPISDAKGNPGGLFIVCRDVTERKKAEDELIEAKEKAEESDRLKTAFIHNISHEVRTPLNAIVGFSALLDQPDLAEADRNDYINIIFQSNNQLLSVVDDILNISYIEAHQIKVKESTFDLNVVIKNLFIMFLPEAQKKNLVFKTEVVNEGSVFSMISDESKIIQILTNLLNNAFKFTHKGQITFGYKIEENRMVIYVEDTGIGIPENEQKRIFERFYQVDNKEIRTFRGTGLGLSISAAYAQLLGGELTVRSKAGEGSVFSFSIPYRESKFFEEPVTVPVPNKETKKGKNKKILVAEDIESNIALLAAMLKSAGYELIHARNGKEVIDILKSDPGISIVLMDMKMPFMDGFEATREIQKIKPGMPVIAQTAFAHSSDRIKALECGCIDYIAKPYSKEQLLTLINKYTD
jgi:PAS domain S-box-containing protein